MTGTALVTFILLLAIAAIAPQELQVTLYKISLVTLGGFAGYWVDRELFPYARPDWARLGFLKSPLDESSHATGLVFAATMLRRAFIVGCAMLAMGMGA